MARSQAIKKFIIQKYRIYIYYPPSKDAIYQRLKSRAITSGDNEEAIESRMNKYETEMSHKYDYDHVVINDKLETCVDELQKIINNKRNSLID